MQSWSRNLMLSGSAIALAAATTFASNAALAQSSGSTTVQPVEEVVVTGTSIRGVAPVGSNLIELDSSQIADTADNTIDQIVKDIPAISNSSSNPQGTQAGNSSFSPTVHDLGSSSSNSTLVLIDGHRIANDGQAQPLTDPGMVPAIMIERVEVLTGGSSSVYGSDAVAGVVNFVTRSSYDGLQVSAQAGVGNGYNTYGAGLLWGTNWSNGSIVFGANLALLGGIKYDTSSRAYLNPNHITQGGTNNLSFNCDPATIQPNGSGNIYLSAAATTSLANTTANSPCNTTHGDLVTPDKRTNAMVKFSHEISDRLTINVDAVYSYHTLAAPASAGTITATAYQTGPQANPFYINPPGVTATKQTIRYDANDLLGPYADPTSFNQTLSYYFDVHPEYRLGDNFRITASAIYAADDNNVRSYNTLNTSAAYEAINGTTNANGSTTTPSVINTSIIATTLPLTTSNALDVWDPLSTNKTSAAELTALTQNYSASAYYYTTQDYKLGLDGKAFDLPGGPVNIAFGGESTRNSLNIQSTKADSTGPVTPINGADFTELALKRNVTSAYGEVLVPLVGPAMEVPYISKFDIDISGRYDQYGGIGSTFNPKFGADWDVVDGLKFHASYGTSFVEPNIVIVGDRSRTGPGGIGGGFTTFTGYSTASSSFTVPQAYFPLAASVPGATCASGTCSINGGVAQGISFNGGSVVAEPGKGKSWEIGLDVSPTLLPGFHASVNLFNTMYINGGTGTSLSTAINTPSLGLLTFYPAGATQAQIQAITGPYAVPNSYPSPIYYIDDIQEVNVLNLTVEGLDMSWNYQYDTDKLGSFSTGGAWTQFLLFNQHTTGGPTFSILGTTGYNNTFPSVAGQGRLNVGWLFGGFSAKLYGNFTSGYRNWSSSTVNPVILTNGYPTGGGDTVHSNLTFDAHLSYTIDRSNIMGVDLEGSQIFLDVVNLADKAPVFYNGSSGYDSYTGNPIGRVITVGLRANF